MHIALLVVNVAEMIAEDAIFIAALKQSIIGIYV